MNPLHETPELRNPDHNALPHYYKEVQLTEWLCDNDSCYAFGGFFTTPGRSPQYCAWCGDALVIEEDNR